MQRVPHASPSYFQACAGDSTPLKLKFMILDLHISLTYAGASHTLLQPPRHFSHVCRWFTHFITSTSPIKTLQNGSDNVIHSATAYTRPFRLKNVVQQILHKSLTFLATWQEFCQKVSFIVMCVHISHMPFIPCHSFMDKVICDAL